VNSMHRPLVAYLILPLVLFVLTTSARVAQAEDSPIVVEARALLEDIDRLEREFKDLRTESREAQEADATAIAELQARRRLVEWMRVVEDLVANLAEQQEQGLDASKFLQATRKLLWSVDRRLPPFFDRMSAENADLRGQLVDASSESAIGIEQRIRGNEELLDEGVRFYISHIEHMDQLELGSTRARAGAAEVLERRAGNLAAKLELVRLKLDEQEGLEGTGVVGESAARST